MVTFSEGLERNQKDIIILLPHLGLHSNQVTKRLESCVYNLYSCINLKIKLEHTPHQILLSIYTRTV